MTRNKSKDQKTSPLPSPPTSTKADKQKALNKQKGNKDANKETKKKTFKKEASQPEIKLFVTQNNGKLQEENKLESETQMNNTESNERSIASSANTPTSTLTNRKKIRTPPSLDCEPQQKRPELQNIQLQP